MIGAEVTELIQGYTIAKTMEGTEQDFMETIFPHPTLTEMMHEVRARRLRPRAPHLTHEVARLSSALRLRFAPLRVRRYRDFSSS